MVAGCVALIGEWTTSLESACATVTQGQLWLYEAWCAMTVERQWGLKRRERTDATPQPEHRASRRDRREMRIDLTGKNALVTGAAAGIGMACISVLRSAGATVIAVDIDEAGLLESVEVTGGLAVQCDVRDPQSVSATRDRVVAEWGGVDILVNCAGMICYRTGVSEVSSDEWNLVLETNLRGTFLVCRAFMADLKERGGGKIVILSSMAARVGGIEVGVHYTCSKAGLIGLTRSLAREGGPFGITANALAPGVILTEPVIQQMSKARETAYCEQIPLGRLGEARDVANAVLFLASPLANYVSGAVLDINGGMYMA